MAAVHLDEKMHRLCSDDAPGLGRGMPSGLQVQAVPLLLLPQQLGRERQPFSQHRVPASTVTFRNALPPSGRVSRNELLGTGCTAPGLRPAPASEPGPWPGWLPVPLREQAGGATANPRSAPSALRRPAAAEGAGPAARGLPPPSCASSRLGGEGSLPRARRSPAEHPPAPERSGAEPGGTSLLFLHRRHRSRFRPGAAAGGGS
ncbi:uncharacterized protein LOC133218149 [Neopsephotus bourkii]|uniref:uncharacterized protein LOC133218149 n=1 Tax=Neopsephotus bourkii TaxID=309878 RepID=UPI002AA5AC31|nr:uncharacterized protein LOC133218149 [Neopsephotus bourkii]